MVLGAIIDGLVDENINGNETQNIVIALARQADQSITKLKSTASDVTKSQNSQDKARLAVVDAATVLDHAIKIDMPKMR